MSLRQDSKTTPSPWDAVDGRDGSTAAEGTFLILAGGAVLMAVLLSLLPAAGHDQMWLLLAAKRMLHGARLYGPQIFESNPPLIVWLSVLPAWIGEKLGVAPTVVGKCLILGIEVVIAAVSLALLRRLRAVEGRPLTRAQTAALGFAFVVVYAMMPARDFGQKDHLLALLCLPYLIAAALRVEGVRLRRATAVLIGFAAGVGIALKPHQVLLPVFVESGVIWLSGFSWRRVLRPAPLALAATVAGYVLLVRAFAASYLFEVVPLLHQTYWAFGHLGFPELVAQAPQLHLLAAAVVVLLVRSGRASVIACLFAFAGAGATLAYYIQGTGWYYQQIPALAFFTFALVALVMDDTRLAGLRVPHWMPWAAAGLSVLAVVLTAHFMGYPFTAERSFPIESPEPSIFAKLPAGTAVATLTTSPEESVPPVFRFHLVLAQRYPHLWLLPAILRSERPEGAPPVRRLSPAEVEALDGLQHRFMVEDLERWRPALILVERCQDPAVRCQVLEDRHDDLLAWFMRDPAFRAEFAHYRPYGSGLRFDAYIRIH